MNRPYRDQEWPDDLRRLSERVAPAFRALDDHGADVRSLDTMIEGAIDEAQGVSHRGLETNATAKIVAVGGVATVVGSIGLALWLWTSGHSSSDPPAQPEAHAAPDLPLSDARPVAAAVPSTERETARVPGRSSSLPTSGMPSVRPDAGERTPASRRTPSRPAKSEPLDAGALFSRANAARRGGRREAALADYARLLQRYPDSREAQMALVGRGRLHLDAGRRPRQAARDFDRYLRRNPDGGLAREAAVGRARAWRAVGDAAQERKAWHYVLDRHPNAVYTGLARRRLARLGSK